ncbi:MAG: nuclear transport factor 2 family protein [Proteobacteria bacterium]|nr:nuclear transport factor 2 family protein [Pseudomonadota bacterium]
MNQDELIERFKSAFHELYPGVEMGLREIYAPSIVFEDPAHRVEGVVALEAYFDKLNAGLVTGRFQFAPAVVSEGCAALPWRMTLNVRRPKLVVEVDGISHLTFDQGRITHQRDYFDLGQLLYERIPILGGIVRAIRRRFAAA